MNHSIFMPVVLGLAILGTACSSSNDSTPEMDEGVSVDLPEGLTLSLLNASTGAYYAFDTTAETRTDLNEIAAASQDSSIQNLQITDTSAIGHFFQWPDFREANGEELLDVKYLLMRPGYVPGSEIDADQFVQLAHFHDTTLAAHSAEEFRDPEPGSSKAMGLQRLNSHVAEQKELEEEMLEVMPDGEQLCQAFVDPYVKFELGHEEEEGAEEMGTEEHAHGDFIHIALSDSGRMYFFAEGEAEELEQVQGFVKLDNVSTISDCTRASITRVSEEGVLVFIPDTQLLYLVDSHGGDYHQHSTWSISAILPEGVSADLIAVIGAGEEHEHE